MNTTHRKSAKITDQEQSLNTPEYWGDLMVETIGGILRKSLPDGLPEDRKEAMKQNIRSWVINIREDEIKAIIREIEKRQVDSLKPSTTQQTVELLRARLPKRSA